MAWTGPAFAQAVQSDEIVVTAEKTERSLQDTASSIAVITGQRIEDENLQDLFDAFRRTANVSEGYGDRGFTIRGVDNLNVSGSGNAGLITIYVDGAALPDSSLTAGPLNMWDVAQVEIARGPQSTLQGRNALAGAVFVNSRDPSYEWEARARGLFSDAGRSYAFAAGGPIIDDQLAFRVAVEDRHENGFVYNTTRNENEDESDTYNARFKLLFEPDALPDLSVLLSYTRNEREAGYYYTYSRTDVDDYWDNRITESDALNSFVTDSDYWGLDVSYDISDRLTLTSVTSWSDIDEVDTYDNDRGPAPTAYGGAQSESETLSQEVRLNYQGERFEGLAGLYYSKRDLDQRSSSRTNVATPYDTLAFVLQSPSYPFGLDASTAAAAASLYVSAMPEIPVDYSSLAPVEIETGALFADGEFHITDRLSVLGGFRYDREDYTITSVQSATFAGTYPNPLSYPGYELVIGGLNTVVGSFVAQASASAPTNTTSFEAFLPKLGLTYDWTGDVSTSFIVQRGYRSGGSQINIARATVVPYDQEFTWNYELSFRSAWLDNTLTVNANVFYVDWSDQQVSVNLGLNEYDYQTENAGSSSLYGFELEVSHQATRQFDWYASLGHTRTEFSDFTVDSGATSFNLSGSEFSNAPHWTASLGGTYEWDDGLFLNLNASWRDESFAAIGQNQEDYWVEARTLVNGKFGYRTEHWSAYVFGDNLFDEEYTQYPYAARDLAMLGAPRVLGVILETQW